MISEPSSASEIDNTVANRFVCGLSSDMLESRVLYRRVSREVRALRHPPIFIGIIIGTFMQFYHNIAHNFVYYLAGRYGVYGGEENALMDMGFQLLTSMVNATYLPSNFCLYALFTLALVVGLSPLVTNRILHSREILTIGIAWRTVLVCSILVFFRTVSFVLTILPSPAPHCQKESFRPPVTLWDVLTGFGLNDGCSDLLFSSHMLYGATAAAMVTHYIRLDMAKSAMNKTNVMIRHIIVAVCCSLVVGEGLFIVAENRHYSVDVWTAMYVVPLTWSFFCVLYPKDPLPPVAIDEG